MSSESTTFEKHFTPQYFADLWGCDESTIRRMFMDEPGVLKLGRVSSKSGKRKYVTLRIPIAVAKRVYERKTR
jgi:hypothetical protein